MYLYLLQISNRKINCPFLILCIDHLNIPGVVNVRFKIKSGQIVLASYGQNQSFKRLSFLENKLIYIDDVTKLNIEFKKIEK